jgi:hypothetical protein
MMEVRMKRSDMRHATGLLPALIAAALLCGPAAAQAPEPGRVLKAMTDHVASLKAISLAFESDIEVVTPELEKIQFTSSGRLVLNRPNKVRVSRTGGYTDVEVVFDGTTATVSGRNLNAYAQLQAPGTTAQLVDAIRQGGVVDLPGADLLAEDAFEALMTDVYEAKHVGRGVIDGVECEHLAFRAREVDWQIWIEHGAKPIPRKYVITSKTMAGAPQYTLRIRDWRTDAEVAADTFVFQPAAGAKKVDLTGLAGIDEVPEGMRMGEKK